MKSFGVIGAGIMGGGIAQKIALEGKPVTVVDIDPAALERAEGMMAAVFRESVDRKLSSREEAEHSRRRITFSTRLESVRGADLVIEAVTEVKSLKEKLLSQLEQLVEPAAVLATNTSSFLVSDLAGSLHHPHRFVGLHFFFHPVKNRLLEIIPGRDTSKSTAAAARRFGRWLGKVDILCPDNPGFVVNRFFVPWLNESVRLLSEGRASIGEIEMTARKTFGLKIGPFELMNITGIAVAVHACNGLAEFLGDFYRPDPRMTAQMERGLWDIPAGTGTDPDEYVHDRLMGTVLMEAAGLIEGGGVQPLDIELGAQVGLKWPEGPVALYNRLGIKERDRILSVFTERYPDFPVPESFSSTSAFFLSTVAETRELLDGATICTLSLSRPEQANALNEAVFEDLDSALDRYGDASVLVIRGRGKHFAAGADIKFFLENMERGDIGRIIDFTRRARETLNRVDRFSGKVTALVDGYALGGGAELMLSADVVVVTPRALIGFPETGIGIYPGLGGIYRLTRRVGKGLAKYLVGTGRLLSGPEAVAIGLADHCAAPEDLGESRLVSLEPASKSRLTGEWRRLAAFMAEAAPPDIPERRLSARWQEKIRTRLDSRAPIALRLAMEFIDGAAVDTLDVTAHRELDRLEEVLSSEDARIGLKSVGSKMKPVFRGR